MLSNNDIKDIMNYSIFDIESQINSLTKNLNDEEIMDIYNGKSNINYQISIDLLMQNIMNQKIICKGFFRLQEEKRSQFTRAFEDTALVLEYLKETESYLTRIKKEIINDEKKDTVLFILEKLVKYYLSILKEIYVMSINDCFLGATGRYRIFLEIYCVFKYFNKYPDAIARFIDHFLIKEYLMKKRSNSIITMDDTKTFQLLKKRYKNEYITFKQNYGWACQRLEHPNSIKEIIKFALNDEEFGYINTEYNIVSEYSHASLNMAMKKNININAVYNFLGKSGDLSITVMRIYIGWIIEIVKTKDKRLLSLSNFLERLAKYLYMDYYSK